MKRRAFVTLPAVALASAGLPPDLAAAAAGFAPTYEGPSVVDRQHAGLRRAAQGRARLPAGLARRPRQLRGLAAAGPRQGARHCCCSPRTARPSTLRSSTSSRGDGYRQRQILFNVTRNSRVRATMLVPDGPGPFPAALLLHDHGAKFDIGKEKLIEPWYDETRRASAQAWADQYFERPLRRQRAGRAAAMRCSPWTRSAGVTAAASSTTVSRPWPATCSTSARRWPGCWPREDARAAALLATLPEVDHRRIAAVGFSMGAYRAWQVAALSDAHRGHRCRLLDDRPQGNDGHRQQHAARRSRRSTCCTPGLYRFLDIPDVASIAAPRPMLVFNGETRPAVPRGRRRRGLRQDACGLGSPSRPATGSATKLWPGLGHVFDQAMQEEAFAWLDQWLSRP